MSHGYDEVRALMVEARALAQAGHDANLPPSPAFAGARLHQHLVRGGPTRGSRRSELTEVTDSAETPINIGVV
jgi:hypothetical protein